MFALSVAVPDREVRDVRTASLAMLAGCAVVLAIVAGVTAWLAPHWPGPFDDVTSAGDSDNRACKAALSEALAERPNAAVSDWRGDRPELHDPGLFFDQTHYRQELAVAVEREIAPKLTSRPESATNHRPQ